MMAKKPGGHWPICVWSDPDNDGDAETWSSLVYHVQSDIAIAFVINAETWMSSAYQVRSNTDDGNDAETQ